MKTKKRCLSLFITALAAGLLMACQVLSLPGTPTSNPTVNNKPTNQEEHQQHPEPTSAPAVAMEVEKSAQQNGVVPTPKPPNADPYYDNFFENYGVNPMVDTEDDHLSTFALDVDTGSYTISRRYIHDGNMPDKDSVRVEEFVNYFNHAYPYPAEGQAFAVYMDGGAAPFTETEKYQMLRIGVQGYAVSPEERKDVSLTFVIDVSGSMDMENRLELVKKSLELLVEMLRPSDSVGIVVYGTTAHVLLDQTSGADKETIMNAINSLEPEGVTNAEAGIRLAYRQALKSFKNDGINRVILCSDGVANVGDTSAGGIWDEIKSMASEGITLTTVGFGMGNYNDILMEQLADKGDGFYAYVDTLNEARRIFVQNLTSTLQVIAMNAKIQVDFNPQVVSRYRLVGFENRAVADEDFRNDKVDGGEIGAGHSITALYEIKLAPEASGRVATVILRWEDPDTHQVKEISQDYTSDGLAVSFSENSPSFQWDVIVAEFAEVLRQSYWAQKSSFSGVLEEAERVVDLFDKEDVDMNEFVMMVREAKDLTRE